MASSPSNPLLRRLIWTLGIVALYCCTDFLQLPSIDSVSSLRYDADLSITALKLWPFIASFILVELVALAFPGWRRQRQEPPFRKKMKLAAIVLGVLIATYMASRFAAALAGSQIYESPLSPSLVGSVPSGANASMMVFLVLGSLACLGMALRITAEGVGNGFAVLWLADLVRQAVARVSRWNWSMVVGDGEVFVALVVVCLVLVAFLVAIWLILTMSARVGERISWQIPLSGIWPCYVAGWIPGLAFGPMLSLLGEDVALTMMRPTVQQVTQIVLMAIMAPFAAHLFYWRHRLEHRAPENREKWHSAQLRSLGILVATSVFPLVVRALFPVTGPWFPEGPSLWVATAIVIDLKEEIQARRRAARGVDLVPGPSFHDVLEAIRKRNESSTSEPHCIQALRLRSLFHILAPYAPMVLLVPSEAAPATASEPAAPSTP